MTRREQALLAGAAIAVFIGAAVLYLHDRREGRAQPSGKPAPLPVQRAAPPADAGTGKQQRAEDRTDASTPAPETAAAPPSAPEPEPAAGPIAAGVMGAVTRPGLYSLPRGSRIAHLLERAGGPAPDADTEGLNLAARLIDGTTLTVPRRETAHGRNQTFRRRQEDAALYRNPAAYLKNAPTPPAPAPAPAAETGSPAGSLPAGTSCINLNTADLHTLESLPGIGPELARRIVQARQEPFQRLEDLLRIEGTGEGRLAAIRPFVTIP
jgi:competence protein ComEA